MSKGRYERKKEKKKGGKVLLIVIAVILAVVVAVAAAGILYYNSMLNRMKHVEVPKIQTTTAPATEPAETEEIGETTEVTTEPTETVHISSPEDYVNILVVGQASRAGEEERHADTMILLTLNKYEKTVSMISVLRDTLVQRGGSYKGHTYGGGKINAMYHMGYTWDGVAGSMAVMNQILYDNFGVEVDYNFELDFDAFIKVIDLIGGIYVELDQAEVDYLNADDFWVYKDVEVGEQKLDGMTALCYARMRKAEGDGESDIKRTERQRKVITAVIDKMKTRNLSKLQEIAYEVLPYVTTSMTNTEITELLLDVLPMVTELEIVSSGTCPASGTYSGDVKDIYGTGIPQSILRFNEQENKKIMRAITEGENAE